MIKILAWHFLSDDGRLARYERPDGIFKKKGRNNAETN